ncbi:hypothetical protein ABT169_17655 [Streptomyces sp. NPDC001616]|uniref:hypothetical protein n=1 Tax=Streptomyces sp. NPDC001616 TaxID=3156648 RepID=UPI00331A8E6F
MQKPTGLSVSVYRAGGDPDKQYVTVTVQISGPRDALLDLPAEERQSLLVGALEGMDAALPDTYDVAGTITLTDLVPVVFEDETPEQPAE